MARLLDDLMDVGRIARDRLELRPQRVDLVAVVHRAVETSNPLIERFRHHLHLALPSKTVYLDADPVRLGQIIGNLLNNACRYTDPGGHIWMTVELNHAAAVVAVRDSGIGIPEHKLPTVFDLFSQVDASLERSQGGLGIGLHLVKRLVDMHGGEITAQSAGAGLGSTFTVRLPLAAVQAESAPPRAVRSAAAPPASRRILVVDDNVDAATMLALLLTLHQHQTEVAHDGVTALSIAESFRPNVVLLDIGLPQLNGYDVCRRIREQSWSKDLVIIALTGWGQESDCRQSRDAGFDHHLVKPVDHTTLLALLASVPLRRDPQGVRTG